MLSKSLFKAELVAFHDSRKPPQPDEQGRLVGNRNSADLRLLDRWIARRDRQNLDEKLKKILRVITTPELARLVLAGRRKALATVRRTYGVEWKTSSSVGEVVGLDSKWRKLKDELTDNVSLSNLEILERAYFLHSDYADLAGDFNKEPSQRDVRGSRHNTLFWDFVASYLYIRSGKWFDNEVAILTEIAFDLPDGSVSSEHITDARRQR